MEFRHLESLVAAAECGSFTRAADRLQVTQATVSQHIAALEEEFRVQLFDRTGRATTVTAEGKRLYEYGRRVLALLDRARREISAAEPVVRGELKIATSTVPFQRLLPKILAAYRKQHPRVRESVIVSDSTQALRAIADGEADVALTGDAPRAPHLSSRPIADDELVLVVGPQHPFADRKTVKPGDLADEPMIVRESGSGSRRCVDDALRRAGWNGSRLRIAIEMNSSDAIQSAVAAGLGIAFLSRRSVEVAAAAGDVAIVDVAGVCAKRHLYLVTHDKRTPTAAARAFIDSALEATEIQAE